MPKERRERISRPAPYHSGCSSSRNTRNSNCSSTEARHVPIPEPVITPIEAKEYNEARCPVCMDHPHNAVLLQCTSSQNGCRAFMCDTSYRHSNCLDQFRKSNDADNTGNEEPAKLYCPLCRGSVTGWTVVESARNYMNLKQRSCASESCEFTGTYGELRKHAREVHPNTRPSQADPERMRDWRRMERERDIGDLFSVLGEDEEFGGGRYFSFPPFAIFLIVHVLSEDGSRTIAHSNGSAGSSMRSRRSSPRGQRRRRVLWGESVNDMGDGIADGDREGDDSYDEEGGSEPQRTWGRTYRRRRRLRMTQSDDDSEV
ncbi:hypothetical protein LUZ63_014104 [Rhynchospora breviuscula]|uniref:Uncharacterized protein n=1 Tax=Rhynchospora breviuscula TaxID=2022672 RepID=A0A9Q0C9S4_9POAL|nr:hypothetical protein LUZ63_014104 [Rhynchospora breviuscula]